MKMQSIYTQIRSNIGQDNIEKALQLLQQLLAASPQLDEVILQSARFKAVRKHIRSGSLSHDDTALTLNQIRMGLLELVREMETQGEEPAIYEAAHSPQVIQNAEKIYNIEHIDQANFN